MEHYTIFSFPGGSDSKESACNAGDLGVTPGSGRSAGGGHGNLLQYSYLENSMDRGAWWATVHGVTESDMTEWLSTHIQYLRQMSWISMCQCVDINSILLMFNTTNYSVQFSSVAQSCPTLCHPMNRSTPGLPVHHQLPEFTQTHVHRVGDAIQPSHLLSFPSPPAPNPSQHQSLFQWVNSSHEVAKVLEFQL